MAIITGNSDVCNQILKLLGVNDRTEIKQAIITMAVDDVVKIDIERYADIRIDPDTKEVVVPVELTQYVLSAVEVDDMITVIDVRTHA